MGLSPALKTQVLYSLWYKVLRPVQLWASLMGLSCMWAFHILQTPYPLETGPKAVVLDFVLFLCHLIWWPECMCCRLFLFSFFFFFLAF